jgi:hypothetical protein
MWRRREIIKVQGFNRIIELARIFEYKADMLTETNDLQTSWRSLPHLI